MHLESTFRINKQNNLQDYVELVLESEKILDLNKHINVAAIIPSRFVAFVAKGCWSYPV